MLWLSSEKPVPHAPIMSPRTAKVIAVATSAMQLAMNKRLLSAADRAAVPAPLACALKAGSSYPSLLSYEHEPFTCAIAGLPRDSSTHPLQLDVQQVR